MKTRVLVHKLFRISDGDSRGRRKHGTGGTADVVPVKPALCEEGAERWTGPDHEALGRGKSWILFYRSSSTYDGVTSDKLIVN